MADCSHCCCDGVGEAFTLALPSPRVCGKCFFSIFMAASVSNGTLPVFYMLLFISFFLYLYLYCEPTHPCLLSLCPCTSWCCAYVLMYGQTCGVLWLCVCVLSVCKHQRRKGKQRGSNLSVCTLSSLSRLSPCLLRNTDTCVFFYVMSSCSINHFMRQSFLYTRIIPPFCHVLI